jgi:hypothetical protein
MQFGGDIERILAWIYPNRVLVGVVTGIVVLAIVMVGYARGWHRVARRHPRTSVAAIVFALVVTAPIAWVLGSPLFIRTELVETAPDGSTAVASPSLPIASASPPESGGSPSSSASSPPPPSSSAPSLTPFEPITVARGRFRGADDFHYGSGIARVLETKAGEYVLRFEDLSVRNGPDLYVYLSPSADGYASGAIELGQLKATDGSFNYAIPAGTDVNRLRSAVVWCKAFSVQFAHASFQN